MDVEVANTTTEEMPLHILEVSGENIKRMRFFEFKVDPVLQVFMGDNAQGKTSAMDAMVWCFAGAAAVSDKPIRDGEISAHCELKLGYDDTLAYTVKRTFEQGKASKVEVWTAEGHKVDGSPQKFMDAWMANFHFDPISFMRMKPADQRDALLALPSVGIDFTKIDQIDQKHAITFAKRTEVGRDRTKHKGAFTSIKDESAGLPREEISGTDLTEKYEKAMELQQAADRAHAEVSGVNQKINSNEHEQSNLSKQWHEIDEKQKAAREEAEQLIKARTTAEEAAQEASKAIPDIEAIKSEMATAEATNAKIRTAAERRAKKVLYDESDKKYKEMTAELDTLTKKKTKMLSAAEFPLDDLNYSDHGVLYKGHPLDQASGAEQLQVAMSIGFAGNPRLRVMTIPDASLFDDENLGVIYEMAKTKTFQVIAERVGKKDKVGIVFEDGAILETRERAMPEGEPAEGEDDG